MAKNYETDFTKGGLLKPLLMFALPLILSGMLQLLYNAADIVVVGNFAGKESLAAVGSTGSLINLLTNAFLGLSVGANVIIAKAFGTKDSELLEKAVHTSVALSLIGGIIFGIIGFVFATPILRLMGNPEDVLPKASLYVKIYFAGLPAIALYNFSSAILRAIGDTKRPLYFLTVSGIVNVVLNLIFVIKFKMDVAGVATATVISQFLSAILTISCLMKTDAAYKLVLKRIRICKREFLSILKIGLPAGIQGSLFSLSNVVIQSSVNSFGSIAVAGNAAASNIEGFVYIAMNAIHQTTITFCAQNLGVRNFQRIKKGVISCTAIVSVIGIALSALIIVNSKFLVGIYSSDPDVIRYGIIRLTYICLPYFLCGIMEVYSGALRGLSHSFSPMILCLMGACVLRLIWVEVLFNFKRSIEILLLAYPFSWTITTTALIINFLIVLKKLIKTHA